MLNEYSSGPFVALEICGEDAVAQLRSIVGPRDVDVALRVRGHTLRAKYGVPSSTGGPGSTAKLGLHCTDLAEDGPLECEYIFCMAEK
jgi:nucleoside-diphosphate kinase